MRPPAVTWQRGAAAAALGVLTVSACATDDPPAPSSTEAAPSYVGQVGVPVHAAAANGATADITLDGATWIPTNCVGGRPCGAVELTIVGTSSLPFRFDEAYVIGGYGGGPSPWTHPEDANTFGGSPQVDYVKIGKVPPLRSGEVTTGRAVHGFVGLPFGSKATWYVTVDEPGDPTHVETGWKIDP